MLNGYKTYILALVGIVYGIVGWIWYGLDPVTAQEIIWAGLTAAAIRAGIASK
jgi:hypothetical protein